MTTCAEIISQAYRRSGIKARGVALSSPEQQVGLERLQGMYMKMVGDGLFGQFVDYYLQTGPYTALEGQRIYKADNASVVTIPATLTDVDTGKTRAPRDGAAIIVIDPNATASPPPDTETDMGFKTDIHLYDALKGWCTLNDLAVTDYAPMSGRHEDGLKSMLAVELCDEFGYAIPPLLARQASTAKLNFGSKNDQPRRRATPDYF